MKNNCSKTLSPWWKSLSEQTPEHCIAWEMWIPLWTLWIIICILLLYINIRMLLSSVPQRHFFTLLHMRHGIFFFSLLYAWNTTYHPNLLWKWRLACLQLLWLTKKWCQKALKALSTVAFLGRLATVPFQRLVADGFILLESKMECKMSLWKAEARNVGEEKYRFLSPTLALHSFLC